MEIKYINDLIKNLLTSSSSFEVIQSSENLNILYINYS